LENIYILFIYRILKIKIVFHKIIENKMKNFSVKISLPFIKKKDLLLHLIWILDDVFFAIDKILLELI
jgi:hypothetical protein